VTRDKLIAVVFWIAFLIRAPGGSPDPLSLYPGGISL
jgi:hypothetical protein